MLLWRLGLYLEPLKHPVRQRAAVVHFELPVSTLVVLDPSFKFFDRPDARPFEDEFAFGSDTLDAGEGCGLEEFEMFAYSLESNGVVFCMVLPERASEEMSVYIA